MRLSAQSFLDVPVKVDIENGSVEDVLIKVIKNGKPSFTQSSVSKLKLKLNFNSNYTIVFSKPGYITKSIEFDTKAPADHIADGFDPYKIGVKLFKQYDGVNITVYNQPVGKIKFDRDIDEFNYDTDYSKSILSNLQETEQKLEARAKEEKKTGVLEITATEKSSGTTSDSVEKEAALKENSAASINPPAQQESASSSAAVLGNDHGKKMLGSGGEQTKEFLAMEGSNDVGAAAMVNTGNDTENKKLLRTGSDHPPSKPLHANGNDNGNAPSQINEMEKITREDIVEKNRIITLIKVTRGKTTTAYRRVIYHWGGPFYFKNDVNSISENIFALNTGIKD